MSVTTTGEKKMTMHRIAMGDKEVLATRKQIESLSILSVLRKGGIASVRGYRPTTDYVRSPVVNLSFISRFSLFNLYNRKIVALRSLSFDNITIKGDKVASLSREEQVALFESCKETMIQSMTKTLDGVRDDAHRIAHDTFYAKTADGIKVHLRTRKEGKETVLDLEDGLPVVDSIMVGMIELHREIVEEGEKKVVKNGAKVQMDKCIEKALNGRSVSYRTLSLKEGNFDSLRMDGETFTPDSIMDRIGKTITTEDLTNILSVEEDAKV
jgi:hypothetical protein